VQIEDTVLEAGERAPQVPEDTAQVPLVMRVKGFAQQEAAVGEDMEIETIIGRRLRGKLIAIEPAYEYDFGRPVRELLEVGSEARQLIADDGGGSA
jgi:hypothetical protein